ncbi:hypothetical protein Tco_1086168 [Tanacetum coccineum]
MTQSCCVYFPSLLLELQRDGWIDYLQEQSTPRIFSRRPSFKGIVRSLKWQISLRKFITLSKNVKRHCTKHKRGPIPNKTLAQASDAIQTMDDHSQKWYDLSTSKKASNGISDGISAITSKLDSLGKDMKKLKENVHAIQVGCENWRGAHLNKECPLNEEIEQLAKDYQAKAANEVLNLSVSQYKAIFANNKVPTNETSSKGTNELHGVSFIYDDHVQIEQLAKDYQAKAANEVLNLSVSQYKAIFANNKVPTNETSSKGTNELHGVSFIYDDHVQVSKETGEGP